MNSFDSILFMIVAFFAGFCLLLLSRKEKKIKDLQDTVDSDKRLTEQYKLRRQNRKSSTWVILLIGALLAIVFIYFLN